MAAGQSPSLRAARRDLDPGPQDLQQSPYLHGLPRMAIQPQSPSSYGLRRQRCAEHLSTVEVAIALLEQVAEPTASSILRAYFRVFTESYMAARHGHSVRQYLPEMLQLRAYNSHNHLPPDES